MVNSGVPLTTRLAIEIPKPKDWQAFQRNCVLLFRAELNDPHAQEYGRTGQNQGGIDILARRNGKDEQFVGVQCRLISKPLKEEKILADARAALKLKAGLRELIFATTAPDDTGAADAAIAVSRILKEEGHDLLVIVYGWNQLQTLIVPHDIAYNAFHPSAVASANAQSTVPTTGSAELAALVAAQVVEQIRGTGLAASLREDSASSLTDEDPALHARIDTFRDLFKEQAQPQLAEKGLLGLLEKEDLKTKPYARYRIESNLASVAIDLGREMEAAARFEAAHAIRPDDPNALANLALARTIQGRFDEAMAVARAALDATPPSVGAIGYLLQAAARSNWIGDPEELIPEHLRGTLDADIGLAEFLRRRDLPGWALRTLEMARRHSDNAYFQRIRAVAVLSLAIDSEILVGGHGPVTSTELNEAADILKTVVEKFLDVNFADVRDLIAHLNNSAVLLRLCGRYAECEALLVRGMERVGDDPQLRRLLAVARTFQNRSDEAIAALAGDNDPENRMLRADIQASTGDVAGGLASILAVNPDGLPERLQGIRHRLLGEMAVRLGDQENLAVAIAGLRTFNPDGVAANLLAIRGARKSIEDKEAGTAKLRALAASLPPNVDPMSRYLLAEELSHEQPEEASRLLDGHVDLSRSSAATSLYLQSLAAARRDDAFQSALRQAAPEVQNDPGTLWTVAAHAWNLGDLKASMAAIEALLASKPDDARARLLKIEILIRQDRSADVFTELERPIEKLTWSRTDDQFRVASLLGHFGFAERAAAWAYHLFLQHRDMSRAWMTLSMLVLESGRGSDGPRLWEATEVGSNAAVDLRYSDETETFFVVEPNVALRKLDPKSWEPDHPLVRAVTRLRVGDAFTGPDGRNGVVRQIRHKYVARLHYVLKHHEARFPGIMGFRSVPVDPKTPGGLDAVIQQIKARKDWIGQEEAQYLNGPLPIGVLADRLGMDTIEVSAGLVAHGVRLKVATGNPSERNIAEQSVRRHASRGCVLDLLAFWTAWRLGALEAVRLTCGQIHLPQSVLDQLRVRRDRFDDSASDGLKTAGYDNGKITLYETSPEIVVQLRDEIDHAIAWAEANTTISPVVANDDLPSVLREYLRSGRSDLFHSLILARQTGLLLVTDDLPTREIDRALGGVSSAWLHAVFGVALASEYIDIDQYVGWSAKLIAAGHGYLSVSSIMLARAARLDAGAGQVPGDLLTGMAAMIGGVHADPTSHIQAVVGCLRDLWEDLETARFRQSATGYLLRQLVRERRNDYAVILRTVLVWTKDLHDLTDYIHGWLRGHFLANDVFHLH